MAKGGFPRGMGGGGMMRQQAQMQQKILKMQKEIEAAQQKVEETLFTASVGGGAVKAVCSGKKELTELHISHDVLSPEDAEAVQDMVLSAVNEALRAASQEKEERMSALSGGMNIPGLF